MRRPRRSLRLNDPGSTRDLLLEEAMRVIARRGVEEVRVKDLAEAVGIQPPSVYRHFSSREDILVALSHRMVEDMARFLQPDPSLPPKDWMRGWVRSLVWFYANRPAYVILILREIATPAGVEAMEAALGPPEEAFARGPLRETSAAFDRMYARGLAEGVFREVDMRHVNGFLHGAIMTSLHWPYGSGRRPETPSARELMRLQDDAEALFDTLTAARG